MTRTLMFVALMFLLAVAAAACGSNGGGQEAVQPTASAAPQEAQPTAAPSIPAGAVEVVNRDGGGSGEYRFVPSEFKFDAGQEVTFALISETEFHTFTVNELGINASMDPGETVLFTFTFDEPGVYELICVPHQTLGMVGEIVVE